MVEDLLAEGGIIVSHQTVRAWANNSGGNSQERSVAGQLAGTATNGIWMKLSSRSEAASTGFGGLSIRRASCWMFWYKPAATGRQPFC